LGRKMHNPLGRFPGGAAGGAADGHDFCNAPGI
jgi:hypothetical protein